MYRHSDDFLAYLQLLLSPKIKEKKLLNHHYIGVPRALTLLVRPRRTHQQISKPLGITDFTPFNIQVVSQVVSLLPMRGVNIHNVGQV